MPSIEVKTPHNLGLTTAKQRVENVAAQLKNRLGVEYHWEGNDLKFSRTGANGTISVGEHEVMTTIELGMMLSPFKGEVQKQLKGFLDENLK